MLKVGGTGATAGLLLVRLMTAPPAWAGVFSWSATSSLYPLPGEEFATEIDSICGGVAGMVKVRAGDQSVSAGAVGEELPWAERTRQNLVPEVSDRIV